jgi:hypothetical protein
VENKEATANTQIDPASAESFIAEKRIGERIKRLRLKKSMGLVELGRHTGLSASFLSQLETLKLSRTHSSAFIGRRSACACPRPE